MGLKWWFLWNFEYGHTKHTSWLSSSQRSLSSERCRLQNVSPLLSKTVWWSCNDLFPHTGHSLNPMVLLSSSTHNLQTLWVQRKITGSLQISQHTAQEKSSTEKDSDAILLCCSCAVTYCVPSMWLSFVISFVMRGANGSAKNCMCAFYWLLESHALFECIPDDSTRLANPNMSLVMLTPTVPSGGNSGVANWSRRRSWRENVICVVLHEKWAFR